MVLHYIYSFQFTADCLTGMCIQVLWIHLFTATFHCHLCICVSVFRVWMYFTYAGTSDHCPRGVESVSECQAAVNYSLQLVCSQCSAGIKWDHFSNGQWHAMTCTEQTLEFPAEQVVLSLAGCYRCWCSLSPGGSTNSVVFSVDVKPPGEVCYMHV